ncbi:MAG: hypothetical protein HYV03_03515 [Deltaproteobacteria bacterium]|nr:hypothetical protein [Deltaproteobacteria bacterium]
MTEPAVLPAATLSLFDQYGAGDRDLVPEWPDLNPQALSAKFRTIDDGKAVFRDGSEREGIARLWSGYQELCTILKGNDPQLMCAARPADVTEQQLADFRLAVAATSALAKEDVIGKTGLVIGDSLTAALQFATQPAADTPPLLASQILYAIGVNPLTLGNVGLAGPYPFDGRRHEEVTCFEWLDYAKTLFVDQIRNVVFGGVWAPEGLYHNPGGLVTVAGVGGATTHDLLRDQEGAERWDSPATALLNRMASLLKPPPCAEPPRSPERWRCEKSYLRYALADLEGKLKHRGAKGGFFAVALGSNDLMTFRHVVINAPERTPEAFQKDLIALDEGTRLLSTQHGVRRVYLMTPDVSLLFHPLPAGTTYTDGRTIPPESRTLYHWVLAAKHGRSIPPQFVLEGKEFTDLRARYRAFQQVANVTLGVESNWLIIDNDKEFHSFVNGLLGSGVSIDKVPGYGKLRYSGVEGGFSPDNEHPSNFGYLLWSELIVQALVNAGFAMIAPLTPAVSQSDLQAAVLERAKAAVRANPSLYRPSRLPYDDLVAARDRFEKVLDDEADTWRPLADAADRIWPSVSSETLVKIAEVLHLDPRRTGSDAVAHHVLVGDIRQTLEGKSTEELRVLWRESVGPILLQWLEAAIQDANRKARFARVYFGALGPQGEESAEAIAATGVTPGFFRSQVLFRPFFAQVSKGLDLPYSSTGLEIEWPANIGFLPLGIFDLLGTGLQGRLFVNLGQSAEAYLSLPLLNNFHLYADSFPQFTLSAGLGWAPRYHLDADEPWEGNRGHVEARLTWTRRGDPAFQVYGLEVYLEGRNPFGLDSWRVWDPAGLELGIGLGWRFR